MSKIKTIKPIIVLSAICIAVAVLLGGLNMITGPIIEDAQNAAANAALLVVLPGAKDFEQIELTEEYPAEIKKAYKADIGYVFETDVKGKEKMTVMCGVDNDGGIVKIEILSEQETPGYKDKIFPLVIGDNGAYKGMTSSNLEAEIASGATLSSNAIYDAVKASLNAYAVATGGEIVEEEEPEYTPPKSQREDGELLTLAGGLIADSEGFEFAEYDAKANGLQYLAKVMKEKSGKGYVAYLVVMSQYGTVETETLVHIANNQKITGIQKLVWKTSDAMYGYQPPEEGVVNAFYDSLIGKDLAYLESLLAKKNNDDGTLVTNATNTSKNLVSALIEAVETVEDLIMKDMPTPEDEVITLAGELMNVTPDFENVTPEGNEYIRRLYKDKGGKGYVAYLVVISENYGTVETETLVHIGNDGRIKGINKMIWKTSDAMYGYQPPEEGVVNAFYDSLIGKNLAYLEALVTKENNDDGMLATNATSTSKNLAKALVEAVSKTGELIRKDMPTPEDEVISLAGQLAGEAFDPENITPIGFSYLRRLYKDKNGNGFVSYLVVISENYGTVETETLVHIGNDGLIKGINKMVWKTSDAIYGYQPPEAATVDAFYNGLIGKDISYLEALLAKENNDDGMLVTNATNTSKNLVNSLIEALTSANAAADGVCEEPKDNNAPLAVGIALVCVTVIFIAAATAVPKVIRRRKNG